MGRGASVAATTTRRDPVEQTDEMVRRSERELTVARELAARFSELQRQHRCTASSLRECEEHTNLVERETGVRIDDPALVNLASRAYLSLIESQVSFRTWIADTAAALREMAAKLDKSVTRAPKDVPVPHALDRLVALVRDAALKATSVADTLTDAERTLTPSRATKRLLEDRRDAAAWLVERWVRQQAPGCRRHQHVVVGILTHHGWSIAGDSVSNQASTLKAARRRRSSSNLST